MAQWVGAFCVKHEDPNLNPQHPHKTLGFTVYNYNPSTVSGRQPTTKGK